MIMLPYHCEIQLHNNEKKKTFIEIRPDKSL